MSDEPLRVRDLGESGLLARLQRFCPAEVVGDDGAVIETIPDRSLVVTTDVLVDGVHFSDRTTTPFDVGWRATAANLSDLAAMGAMPLGIVVGLALPGTQLVSWVEEVYRGLDACLQRYQTPLVGGDVCRSQVVTLSITAFGTVLPQKAIRRHLAQPGDAIFVTGLHGLSRGGLELLLDSSRGKNLTSAEREKLITAHQRPQPRLDVLPYLANFPKAIAGMDSSDGLADAIAQICQASGVGAVIDRSSIVVDSGLSKLADPNTVWDWIFYGGEDFELVLCLDSQFATDLVRVGRDSAIIGKITAEKQIEVVGDGASSQILDMGQGFCHF